MDKSYLKNLIPLIFLFAVLFSQNTFGRDLYSSSHSIGLGSSLSADPYSVLSRYDNPAGASLNDHFVLCADYYRRFGLKELDTFNFIIYRPFHSFSTSLQGHHFGGNLYSEQSISGSVSRILFKKLSAGIQFGKEQIDLKNYGNESRDFLDMGLQAHFHSIDLGFHTINLMSTGLNQFHVDDSFSYRFSVIVRPNDLANFYVESVIHEENDPDFAFGLSSKLTELLEIRVGYHTELETIHLGIGISRNSIGLDGGFYHHPVLGWSQAFGMNLDIMNEETQ